MTKRAFATLVMLIGSFCLITVAEAKKDKTPRIPGAMLLVGWPPSYLVGTTQDNKYEIQELGNWHVYPSISADGRIVATARQAPGPLIDGIDPLIVSTYSMTDHKWTEYKNLGVVRGFDSTGFYGASVTISSDGSKLACLAPEKWDGTYSLRILDLKTGKITVGPESTRNAGHLTWSPDGRRIAFDQPAGRLWGGLKGTIFILDIESGKTTKIADGVSPSWSPSGEWIAFLGCSPDSPNPSLSRDKECSFRDRSVSVIRPDGADSGTLVKGVGFAELGPVWSPDSKTILINELRGDETFNTDVYLLDLATRKLTKKFIYGPPIYAWVTAN